MVIDGSHDGCIYAFVCGIGDGLLDGRAARIERRVHLGGCRCGLDVVMYSELTFVGVIVEEAKVAAK